MEDRYEMKTKVWAHRGASAYAPENTLEAFLLAAEQGADGVELDVQLTKDGEMVVVHDEEIDRVSDGSGFVKDYTLAELKILNFNKTHPEYQDVKIPTLREVYEALKPTGMTINVELKTGIFWYKDLEKKLRETEYVYAAEVLGAKPLRIILKHYVPNMLGILILDTATAIPMFIFTEAGLSFLGIGLKAPSISLGVLISMGQQNMDFYPSQLLFPCLVLCIIVMAFNLLGDGLRDALDPRLRQ